MGMMRLFLLRIALAATVVLPAALPGRAGAAPPAVPSAPPGPSTAIPASVVDLRNDSAMAVSVPLGADNGVTPSSDFEVLAGDRVLTIYPAEIYEGRFWSQPLAEDVFEAIRVGSPVRPAALADTVHWRVRKEGEARRAEYKARWEAAKREAVRRQMDELRGKKSRLEEQREGVESRIADAEKALADEESRMDWISGSEDSAIDQALQDIQNDADRRDELQEQRNALSGQSPYPRAEIARITSEIRRLSDRIASGRDRMRSARDRKRTARSSYVQAKQQWERLVAERNSLSVQVRAVDREIRELGGGAAGR